MEGSLGKGDLGHGRLSHLGQGADQGDHGGGFREDARHLHGLVHGGQHLDDGLFPVTMIVTKSLRHFSDWRQFWGGSKLC